MTTNIDALGKKLHTKLDAGLEQLKTMKAHLDAAPKEAEDIIKGKLDIVKGALEEKKQAGEAARAGIEALVKEKVDETKASVAEWKEKRDTKKLEKRAERAEKYAEAIVDVALYSALEAEKAILAAVAARIDAEAAK